MLKYGFSLFLSVSLHVGIILLFLLGFGNEPEKQAKPVPNIIQASVLDDKQVIAEAQRLKQNEIDKKLAQQRLQQTLNKKRKREEQLLRQATEKRRQEEKKAQELIHRHQQEIHKEQQRQAQIKKQQAEETARLAKIKQKQAEEQQRLKQQRQAAALERERQKQEDEARKQALIAGQKAEEARKKAAQARQEALAKQRAEAAKVQAEKDRLATIAATSAIRRKVNDSWIRPMTSSQGLHCTIQVKLLDSGDVMSAIVIKSSGNAIFDRSAENAVRKASPLPIPPNKTLFNRKFRTFSFVFKPE